MSNIDALIEESHQEFDTQFGAVYKHFNRKQKDVFEECSAEIKEHFAEKMRAAYKVGRQENEDSDAVKMNRDFWNS